MDRKKIHTPMHKHGIEVCDLLGPANEFIHVKRLRGSDDASHQFAQALVSTEALLLDPQARLKFAQRVTQLSKDARRAPETPKTDAVC
jgi:uncharacterized protein (TIGR04141 family)